MAFEPTLTAQTDFSPVPRVEILFASVPAEAVTATVYREVDGVASRVRGLIGVFASGGFAGVDTEPPFGVTLEYRAELFDADGLTLGFTDSSAVAVLYSGTVIQSPLDPSRAASVTMLRGAAQNLRREDLGELVQPLGRERPVWVGFGRSGLREVDLSCVTFTDADADALLRVFGDYGDAQLPIVCFRTSLPMGLPRPFFALVRSPARNFVDAHVGGSAVEWRLSADEVSAPAPALAGPTLTYLDMENTYADYEAAEAAYLTYLDAESDFSLAGFAL